MQIRNYSKDKLFAHNERGIASFVGDGRVVAYGINLNSCHRRVTNQFRQYPCRTPAN